MTTTGERCDGFLEHGERVCPKCGTDYGKTAMLGPCGAPATPSGAEPMTMTDDDTLEQRARCLHDEIVTIEPEAAHDWFQATASKEPCAVCAVIARVLRSEVERAVREERERLGRRLSTIKQRALSDPRARSQSHWEGVVETITAIREALRTPGGNDDE